MDKNAFTNICQQAHTAIAENRLHNAIDLTSAIISDLSGSTLADELDALRTDYDAMLRFIAQGGIDPQLQANVNAISRRIIGILQTAIIQWSIRTPFSAYGRIVKSLTSAPGLFLADILEQMRRMSRSKEGRPVFYEALDAAYGMLWALPLPEDADAKLAERITRLDSFAQLVLVSAVTIGTLDIFSPTRIRLLLRLAETAIDNFMLLPSASTDGQRQDTPTDDAQDDDTIEAAQANPDLAVDFCVRTVMGLILVHRRWHDYFRFYDDITTHFQTLICQRLPHDMLMLINDALTRAGLTGKVDNKLDEFMPAIGKALEKNIKRQEKKKGKDKDIDGNDSNKPFKFEFISIDATEDDKVSQLFLRQAQRMTKLREEGYDSNFKDFKIMSKRFNFFEHPAHVFYPFSVKVPFVKEAFEKLMMPKLSLNVIASNRFCDSDCYSYISMLLYIDVKDSSLNKFINEQLKEVEKVATMPDACRGLDSYNNYAQILYRYLNAIQNDEDLASIILLNEENILPLAQPYRQCFTVFHEVATQVNALIWMQAPQEALAVINAIQEKSGATAELLRNKGQALMQMDMHNRAIDALSQAQLLEEDTETAYAIAQCHEALGQWMEAVALLEDTEKLDPELNRAEEIAYCLIKAKHWDEAANRLFQVEFEGRSTKNIQRAIGWCSLHQGKYPRAEQYYSGLASQRNSVWNDHLNLGHALWLQGRRPEAIVSYRTFVQAFNKSKKKDNFQFWQDAFNSDAADLLAATTTPIEISMLMEAIAL